MENQFISWQQVKVLALPLAKCTKVLSNFVFSQLSLGFQFVKCHWKRTNHVWYTPASCPLPQSRKSQRHAPSAARPRDDRASSSPLPGEEKESAARQAPKASPFLSPKNLSAWVCRFSGTRLLGGFVKGNQKESRFWGFPENKHPHFQKLDSAGQAQKEPHPTDKVLPLAESNCLRPCQRGRRERRLAQGMLRPGGR